MHEINSGATATQGPKTPKAVGRTANPKIRISAGVGPEPFNSPATQRSVLINEMDYEVRLATINDADAFCPLLSSLGYPTDTTAIKERLSRILQTPDAVLLVAAHKTTDQVAGVLSIQFIPQLGLAGDVCHICFFVVAENLHRAGIGKLLESTAEELSRKRGCDRMVSLVPDFD